MRSCPMPAAPKIRRRRRLPGASAASAASTAWIDYLRCRKHRARHRRHPSLRRPDERACDCRLRRRGCAAAGAGARRPGTRVAGDRWIEVDDIAAAAEALGAAPRRVFLGIGRQHLAAFAAHPQHVYLVRLVDPPRAPLPLRDAEVIVARGPFDRAGDRAMLTNYRIDIVVAEERRRQCGFGKDRRRARARRCRW